MTQFTNEMVKNYTSRKTYSTLQKHIKKGIGDAINTWKERVAELFAGAGGLNCCLDGHRAKDEQRIWLLAILKPMAMTARELVHRRRVAM